MPEAMPTQMNQLSTATADNSTTIAAAKAAQARAKAIAAVLGVLSVLTIGAAVPLVSSPAFWPVAIVGGVSGAAALMVRLFTGTATPEEVEAGASRLSEVFSGLLEKKASKP